MSTGGTLIKVGLTAAIVGGVLLGARAYQRRLERGRPGPLPLPPPSPVPEPEPPVGACTFTPLFDPEGEVVGTWAEGAEGEDLCVLECVEGYARTKVGPGDLDWSCALIEQPEEFPAPDPCMAGVYSRMPIPTDAQVYEAASPSTRAFLKDLRFHLDYRAQQDLVLDLLDRIATEPSVRSVMVRRALEEIAPGCNWWTDSMPPSQKLAYQSALELAQAAEREEGFVHPQGARKNMVPREFLGLPSTGPLNLAPGQRVEILVVEGPQMRFGEHVIARTVQPGVNPRVVVVDTFRGADVAPQFGLQHGFTAGTEVVLEGTPPTSVYRVYPKDWT